MDQKNRAVFSIAVILLIFAALLISFGRSLFNTHTPDVILPSVEESYPGSSDNPGLSDETSQSLVSVTPKTVQNVIATLDRTDSYYRELSIEQFWTSGSSTYTVQTWVDQDWSLIRQLLPNNMVRQDLISPDTAYYWYEGSSHYESAPITQHGEDLAQRIPTYESVLELDQTSISDAGYELVGDLPCIFVQSLDPVSNHTKNFWVSVDSGLLACAEVYREDVLIYRMSALTPIQSPCPANASFLLPDGTLMHDP